MLVMVAMEHEMIMPWIPWKTPWSCYGCHGIYYKHLKVTMVIIIQPDLLSNTHSGRLLFFNEGWIDTRSLERISIPIVQNYYDEKP